jgi:2-polyprenyl-6-hydroxyphenyl methylase/3-demethylubiquinone-9 3-methyltransferase
VRVSSDEAGLEDERRFGFGENWLNFLAMVDDASVDAAVESLRCALDAPDLSGRRFLDVGSGSGLISLAARTLGAHVISFDDDRDSVTCTQRLRRERCGADPHWQVLHGSVLDRDFLASLGAFDIVYAWGVLHHTGDLWSAATNVCDLVRPGAQLFVSIYNDQGFASRVWWRVKRTYCAGGPIMRRAIVAAATAFFWIRTEIGLAPERLKRTAGPRHRSQSRPPDQRPRGMEQRHDLVDWVGGFPFEVAKPEQVFAFFHARGFQLESLVTCGGGHGCNQFRFRREGGDDQAHARTSS